MSHIRSSTRAIGAAFCLILTGAVPVSPDHVIRLSVDVTDTVHRIYKVHELIPVDHAGDLILLYPEWEPASHAPTASANALAGLVMTADGRRFAWRRDPDDLHAFHVQVPADVRMLDIAFEFVSPLTSRQGPVTMVPGIITVPWHRLLLYPAGGAKPSVAASLALPADMQPVGALDLSNHDGTFSAAPVPLATLIDSPVYAGRAVNRVSLQGGRTPVFLDLVGPDPSPLAASASVVAEIRRRGTRSQAGRRYRTGKRRVCQTLAHLHGLGPKMTRARLHAKGRTSRQSRRSHLGRM